MGITRLGEVKSSARLICLGENRRILSSSEISKDDSSFDNKENVHATIH
jgi:hypothetical protein